MSVVKGDRMTTSTQLETQSKMRRAVSDIVIAEMMLVQATIESASLIGDCISELGAKTGAREDDVATVEPIKNILMRTRDEIVDSYASRFNYLRKLSDS
jgi:hypothetical protein